MTAPRFDLGLYSIVNSDGSIEPGATLTFYESGTTTLLATYSDSSLTSANSNPVVADADGRFSDIFLQPRVYKAILKKANGTVLKTIDPANTPLDATDASFTFPAAGATKHTIAAKLSDIISVKDFGAKGDGAVSYTPSYATTGTDDTAAFNAAIVAAFAANRSTVYVPPGRYVIYGTINLLPGVTLFGMGIVGPYWGTQEGVAEGATLVRPDKPEATGNEPIVVLSSSSGVHGLCIRNDKGGGGAGIVRVGSLNPNDNCVYTSIINCHISGVLEPDNDGLSSIGIYYAPCISGRQRYYHRCANVTITECNFGIMLDGNVNANSFTGITIRESHVGIELRATEMEVIENVFGSICIFNNALLSPTAVAFKLSAGCLNNTFSGYTIENVGAEFDVHPAAQGNKFLGSANAAVPSILPVGNVKIGTFDVGEVNTGVRIMTNPVNGLNTADLFQLAHKVEWFKRIDGVLPQQGDQTGTLSPDANSRVIVRANPAVYSKAAKPTAAFKLRLFADGYASGGTDYVEVDFVYRCTNQSTGAGVVNVVRVVNQATYVTGLHFLTGVAAGTGFGIAVTGGGLGAHSFDGMTVSLEVEAVVPGYTLVSNFTAIGFTAGDVITQDISDAVNLLVVADTAV